MWIILRVDLCRWRQINHIGLTKTIIANNNEQRASTKGTNDIIGRTLNQSGRSLKYVILKTKL